MEFVQSMNEQIKKRERKSGEDRKWQSVSWLLGMKFSNRNQTKRQNVKSYFDSFDIPKNQRAAEFNEQFIVIVQISSKGKHLRNTASQPASDAISKSN